MIVGFNHNFTYRGTIFHIQTEDSGRKSPTIVTLLYHGGTILASRKTSYADIARVDNLDQVVEELMKEQHKGMLRSLKNGEFDEVIDRYEKGGLIAQTEAPVPAPPQPEAPLPAVQPPAAAPAPEAAPRPTPTAAPAPVPPPASAPKKPTLAESSLDEIILSYLIGEDK